MIVLFGFLAVAAGNDSLAQAPAAKFDQRVQVEVVRAKKTRIEGGDFDDKKDRIILKVKFTNSDTAVAYNDCKAELYIWAEHILNRKAFLLLGKEQFTFSLPARGTHTFTSTEVETAWDKTDARFGAKYDGWVIVVRDAQGAILMKKATTPAWLPVAEKLGDLQAGKSYDRDLKVITMSNR
ncbi:MAG TPA: hypothetical protein VF614_10630 [Chthoniobacteraceae bacterium]